MDEHHSLAGSGVKVMHSCAAPHRRMLLRILVAGLLLHGKKSFLETPLDRITTCV